MAMLARFESTEDFSERRNLDRRLLTLQVDGVVAGGPGIDVFIHDLSLSGLLIETCANLAVGSQIEVNLPEAGKTIARVVWSTSHYFGCQFIAPIPKAVLSAAILKNSVAAPRPAPAAPGRTISLPAGDQLDGLSLSTRLRVILALATAVWAAIFLAVAFS